MTNKLRDFATEVVGKPVFMVCNSVGGVAGLQAGVDAPEQVKSATRVYFLFTRDTLCAVFTPAIRSTRASFFMKRRTSASC